MKAYNDGASWCSFCEMLFLRLSNCYSFITFNNQLLTQLHSIDLDRHKQPLWIYLVHSEIA